MLSLLPGYSVRPLFEVRFPNRFDTVHPLQTGSGHDTRDVLMSTDEFRALTVRPDSLVLRYSGRDRTLVSWTPPRGPDPTGLSRVTGSAPVIVDSVDFTSVGSALAPVRLAGGRTVAVSGLIVDAATAAPAGGVFVTIDGRPVAWAEYGLNRPNRDNRLRMDRFTAAIPATALPLGRHTLGVWVLTPDQRSYADVPNLVVVDVAP